MATEAAAIGGVAMHRLVRRMSASEMDTADNEE